MKKDIYIVELDRKVEDSEDEDSDDEDSILSCVDDRSVGEVEELRWEFDTLEEALEWLNTDTEYEGHFIIEKGEWCDIYKEYRHWSWAGSCDK